MMSDIRKSNEKRLEAYDVFGDPIKHAARWLLWLPEAQTLKAQKKSFLKYFTLPGKLAYDIFFFESEGILQKTQRGFPDVRFCDNNEQAYLTAKRLLGNTIGKKDNFEWLVLRDRREFWDGFPYDLYNLDFTGTCFPDNQPPFSNTFRAIDKIIRSHFSRNAFPFVVFLTMKALESETNEEAKTELKQNLETNRQNPNFTEEINSLIPDVESFVNNRFEDFILISIPKIICHLAEAYCDMEVKSRAKYARRRGSYFITKFVFKFTRRRRRTSLILNNPLYIRNVLNIFRLNYVKNINARCVDRTIKHSLAELQSSIKKKLE